MTLLLQAPRNGGQFQYVSDLRDADAGDMNYQGVGDVLDGRIVPCNFAISLGTLVLFRGHNSMRRVTPTICPLTRIQMIKFQCGRCTTPNVKPLLAGNYETLHPFYHYSCRLLACWGCNLCTGPIININWHHNNFVSQATPFEKFLIRIKIRRVKQTSNAIIRMISIGQSAKPLGCGQRSDNDQANYSRSSVKAL